MLHIQLLGLGCPRCAKLAHRAEVAAQHFGKTYRLEKVDDLARILEVGVPVPALLVNGVVLSAGKMPPVSVIQELMGRDTGNEKHPACEDLVTGTPDA